MSEEDQLSRTMRRGENGGRLTVASVSTADQCQLSRAAVLSAKVSERHAL